MEGIKPNLHLAARYGYDSILQQLCESGVDLDMQDEYGVWALMTPDRQRALIDFTGHTALHWAVGRGHDSIVKQLLVFGARPDVSDGFGWTPLHVRFVCAVGGVWI
jgi:ankyrin repeat protein